MKTILSILFLAGLLIYVPKAAGQAFDQGTQVIAVGVGIGSSLGSFNYSSQIPAISLQYERGVWQAGDVGVISLGGYAGYKGFSYKTSSGNFEATSKWNYTILGLRSAFHYQGIENDRLDLFGGLMFSYNILNYSYEDNTGSSAVSSGNFGSSAGMTIYVGGRYYFMENVAAFAELGYGVSYLNLGLAFRL
ncbi:MAG: hypothetical protein JJU34_11640 [Lunatimonas sp.]|uniref:hypothetical protein n=1 Tax=Lunatimonas sp. TaxID=2060141 RepID=UPI00263ACE2A|nr:hypothetical protein [Lunatimonas sp.]MCC5937923.1 hypothetical protein [Lunatimonas sp.]